MSNKQGLIERRHEAELLRRMAPSIRHFSEFQDDNWKAIHAQVQALEMGLDEGDVYEFWPDDDEEYIRNSAMDALNWANSEEESERPSDSWSVLVKK